MKPTCSVHWTATAENDLMGIALFIAGDSPSAALQISNDVQERTAALVLAPQQGRLVPELLIQGISGYREIIISPWRVIHKIEEGRIFILCVVDSRRNVEDLLLARLLR